MLDNNDVNTGQNDSDNESALVWLNKPLSVKTSVLSLKYYLFTGNAHKPKSCIWIQKIMMI